MIALFAKLKVYIFIGFYIVSILFAVNYGIDKERAANDKVTVAVMEARQQAALGTADEISKIEVKNVTIQNEVQREVIKSVVYRECKHSDDGLRLVNEALKPPNATRSSELP